MDYMNSAVDHTQPHGPSSETEINPKVASDILYWSKHFNVTGDELHEAIRVHGHHVAKVQAALAKQPHDGGQHQKKGVSD